ncbi:hypothetical protein F0562_007640 [Nyssa sinensis]|uniref:Uncharacterized protein n=1 Tax=Nyssa sinensis TaxID=561372 RepID=A0A5J5A3X3_9ASTE|nr:hypothetical protein F0562_007640 [Nyssa sinensis]
MASLQSVSTVSNDLLVVNDSTHGLCGKESISSTQIKASSDLLRAIPDLANASPGMNAGVNMGGISNAESVQQEVHTHLDSVKGGQCHQETDPCSTGGDDSQVPAKSSPVLSWADGIAQGEFIPQVALDLEKEFGGFSSDCSFLGEPSLTDTSHPTSYAPYVSIGKANGSNPMAGKNKGQKAAQPKAISCIALALFGSALASYSDSLAGAHIAAAQSNEGPHYFYSCASHGKTNGQAPPIKDMIYCIIG